MSRQIVAYEGEGRTRRPKYGEPDDIDLPTSPPGPIERRVATADERENGFAQRVHPGGLPGPIRLSPRSRVVDVDPTPTVPPPPEPLITLADPPVTPEEEPAVEAAASPPTPEEDASTTETLTETLAILADAARAAEEAAAALEAAQTGWVRARDALEACWLALWQQPDWMTPAATEPGLVAVELVSPSPTHAAPAPTTEPADDAPEVVTKRPVAPDPTAKPSAAMAAFVRDRADATPGAPKLPSAASQLPRGQREVLEAVIRHDGDRRKAAAELHRTIKTVETQLEYVGRKGLLPASLIAKLPARYARFAQPAAGGSR